MNARQKAKKYKKQIEFYKKNLFVPQIKVYNTDVKRYRVKQTVRTDDLDRMSVCGDDIYKYVCRDIAYQISERIVNDIEFKQEPSIIPHRTDITGEIAIVTRRE